MAGMGRAFFAEGKGEGDPHLLERNKETNLQGPKRMSLTPGVLAPVFWKWSLRASVAVQWTGNSRFVAKVFE